MFGLSEAQLVLLVEASPAERYGMDDLVAMSPHITAEEVEGLLIRGLLMKGISGSYFTTSATEKLVAQGFMHMLQTLKDISYAAHLRRHAEFFDLSNKAINWKRK